MDTVFCQGGGALPNEKDGGAVLIVSFRGLQSSFVTSIFLCSASKGSQQKLLWYFY